MPRDRIERLLALTQLAPSHRMTNPLSYRVMGEGAKLAYAEALAGRKAAKVDDPEAARAVREKVLSRTAAIPAMIAVLVHQNEDPEIREEDWATAFMAIQNLCLAAVDMGLGTHIKTGAVMGELSPREAAEEQRVAAIVFLGVPAELPDPEDPDARLGGDALAVVIRGPVGPAYDRPASLVSRLRPPPANT